LNAHCDPRCIFYQNKNYNVSIRKADDMEDIYKKFVSTDFSGKKFGLKDIWPTFSFHYDFFPGEFILVFGDTGLGKTAFMQNIVLGLPDMQCLFLSLETSQNLLYRRFIQIAHKMTKENIDLHYQNNGTDLSGPMSHIQVMTIAPDFKLLRRIIGETNPKIIVVDTTDALPYPGLKDLAKEEGIAIGLKELAQSTDTIIFGIHHISKAATMGPLTKHSGKGSSTFEQKADKIIAIEGRENLPPRRISSLKARDEKPFAVQMMMDGNTFIYSLR
jgi:predicted ATP-dependent serine protease